ncbi:MAG: hypothetical protein ACLP8S_11480 [Solirubrobacteraceae bacterium]
MLVEALDQIPVDLKLAEDYGGKVNPAGAQLADRHWLLARAPQSLNHSQLLGFNERHRPGSRLLLGVPLKERGTNREVARGPVVAGQPARWIAP